MDPSNFWTQLGLAAATGDDDSPPANGVVLKNTLLHANATILENMLWKEVNDYNAAVVPTASAHQPGSLPAVATPGNHGNSLLQDWLFQGIVNTPPPSSTPPLPNAVAISSPARVPTYPGKFR